MPSGRGDEEIAREDVLVIVECNPIYNHACNIRMQRALHQTAEQLFVHAGPMISVTLVRTSAGQVRRHPGPAAAVPRRGAGRRDLPGRRPTKTCSSTDTDLSNAAADV